MGVTNHIQTALVRLWQFHVQPTVMTMENQCFENLIYPTDSTPCTCCSFCRNNDQVTYFIYILMYLLYILLYILFYFSPKSSTLSDSSVFAITRWRQKRVFWEMDEQIYIQLHNVFCISPFPFTQELMKLILSKLKLYTLTVCTIVSHKVQHN